MIKKERWLKFTTYNVYIVLLLVLLKRFVTIPALIIEIIKSTSFIIAIAVVYVYLTRGPQTVMDMYKRLHPSWPLWALLPYDWLLHFVPVLVMGLPSVNGVLTIALMIILIWYLMIESRVEKLYIPRMDYKRVMYVFLPISIALYELFLYLK